MLKVSFKLDLKANVEADYLLVYSLCVCMSLVSKSQILYHVFQNCLKLDRCFGTMLNKMLSYCV